LRPSGPAITFDPSRCIWKKETPSATILPYRVAASATRNFGEVPEAPPLTLRVYVPGVVRVLNVIGYTFEYFEFHEPRLVPLTLPVATGAPEELTTANFAPVTVPGGIRYATFASPGRYPTWSTRPGRRPRRRPAPRARPLRRR